MTIPLPRAPVLVPASSEVILRELPRESLLPLATFRQRATCKIGLRGGDFVVLVYHKARMPDWYTRKPCQNARQDRHKICQFRSDCLIYSCLSYFQITRFAPSSHLAGGAIPSSGGIAPRIAFRRLLRANRQNREMWRNSQGLPRLSKARDSFFEYLIRFLLVHWRRESNRRRN